MTKSQPFCVIGAVQYEMTASENKPHQIANWFHNHYTHVEDDAVIEKKMIKKARATGYHEEGDKVYVISRIKK